MRTDRTKGRVRDTVAARRGLSGSGKEGFKVRFRRLRTVLPASRGGVPPQKRNPLLIHLLQLKHLLPVVPKHTGSNAVG